MKTLILLPLMIIFSAAFANAQLQQFDSVYVFASSPSYDYRNISIEDPAFWFIDSLNSAYERHSAGKSDIILRRIRFSTLRPEIALTNDNFMNINPDASRSMVVWESNKFGDADILFSTYSSGVWSAPIACDTSSGTNEKYPQVIETSFGGPLIYFIAYQKEDDIILKLYSGGIKILDTNLTASDPNPASTPLLNINYQQLQIAYLSETSPGVKKIVTKRGVLNGTAITWNNNITINQTGTVSNLKMEEYYGGGYLTYDYDTLGSKHTVGFSITSGSSNPQREVLSRFYQGSDNYGSETALIPILTDNSSIQFPVTAWHRKTADSSMIMAFRSFNNAGYIPPRKKFYLGNASINTKIAMTDPISSGNIFRARLIWEQQINGKWALMESFCDNFSTGIAQTGNVLPSAYSLRQNYPNPFNPQTKISFDIVGGELVSLRIFNSAGKQIASLLNGRLPAGSYEYNWDASGYASGIYYYTLKAGEFTETRKMLLLK
jgi:hypothetical protein